MRILFTILLSLSVMIADAQESQGEYEDFLADQHLSAKEYILSLFEKYDIVILCERDHREITQYDLILDVISDKRFRSEVGNIYTEIGNFQRNDILNEFLCNDALSERAARREALKSSGIVMEPDCGKSQIMHISSMAFGIPIREMTIT